jgi:DNA-binding response OmpR family regulator
LSAAKKISSKPRTSTLLVVEDEFLIRAMLSDYLQECGYKVLEASTGDEALAIIENVDVVIDLVLTDIRMPGSIDGFALARWIRGNRPDMNVMLASGDAKKADAAKELCEKAHLFEKPYDLDAVVARIRATLGSSSASPDDAS